MKIFNKILLCTMLVLSGSFSIIDGSINNEVTWPQSSVLDTIKNVASQNFLPYPYSSLKKDQASGMYVVIASPSTYIFFDVPNNYSNANGKPMHIGAIYDNYGNLKNIIQGLDLVNLLAQYGVAIDEMGNQYLGACNQQPLMLLDPSDLALRPGASGKSMICSNNAAFPSTGITSPISNKNSKFYFYYNNLMDAYFVMQVTGNLISYINLSHGYVYNLDGSSRVIGNIVGVLGGHFLLAYLNSQGSLQCFMEYNSINNTYSDFINSNSADNYNSSTFNYKSSTPSGSILTGVNAPYNSVTVDQTTSSAIIDSILNFTTPTKYNVYWDPKKPTTYTASSSYQWQNLQRLPIDMTSGSLLQNTDNECYNNLALILKNNTPRGVIFSGQFFLTTQLSANSYQLNSQLSPIILSIEIDRKTNVQYVCVATKDTVYNYQYSFLTLPIKELKNYQSKIWIITEQKNALENTVLVKNLPLNANGYVQLSAIGIKNILNTPTDPIIKIAFDNSIKSIAQDTVNNRFLTMISPTEYNDITQSCYVDLASGILFNSYGIATGNTLPLKELNALLAKLLLNVVYDKNQAFLSYATDPSAQNSIVTPIDSSSLNSMEANLIALKISTLSKQNIQLQSDITKYQDILNHLKNNPNNPSAIHETTINKNKILTSNQQINLNNIEIAKLKSTAAISTISNRSTLLSRFNSKKLHKNRKIL